jgi:hypothetical protein
MPHHHQPAEHDDIWSVEGRFQHLIYSPKGGIEGLLIETEGIVTQFAIDPDDAASVAQLLSLRRDQALVVEGREAGPSPKGDGEHVVYHFERLAAVDGRATHSAARETQVHGKVVRLNFAKHGAANGVVLDSGDFVHLRPQGMERLQLKPGDQVEAEGAAHPLVTVNGWVIEAHSVNGEVL